MLPLRVSVNHPSHPALCGTSCGVVKESNFYPLSARNIGYLVRFVLSRILDDAELIAHKIVHIRWSCRIGNSLALILYYSAATATLNFISIIYDMYLYASFTDIGTQLHGIDCPFKRKSMSDQLIKIQDSS